MNRSLNRLLRIRELIEDKTRLDLERNNAAMRTLEESAGRQRRMVRQIQDDAVKDLTGQAPMTEQWLLDISDAALTGGREARLGALAAAMKPAVEQARDALVERRRDRRQAEILQADAEQKEEKCQLRRNQNRTDDWFQSRSRRRRGRR